MDDAIDGMRKKFRDVGKDLVFAGDFSALTKEIGKTEKRLDSLYKREDKLRNIGANINTQGFRSLEYDISKTLNQLDILKEKYVDLQKAASKRIAEIPIQRSNNTETDTVDEPRVTTTSAASLNYDPAAMKAVFGNVAAEIKNWRDAVNQSEMLLV